jgi:hypothetical protein
LSGALLGEPEGKSITVQVAGAVDLKLEFDLAGVNVSVGCAFLLIRVIQYLPANWSP